MEEVSKERSAFFLISLIIISLFSFTLETKNVSAQDTGCCEETRQGEFCIETTQNECKEGKFRQVRSCSDTSTCSSIAQGGSLGCCYFPNSQESCINRAHEQECTRQDGQFFDNPDCSAFSECSLGCCVLGSQADLKTRSQCTTLSEQYNLEIDFRSEITDQFECDALGDSQEQGCCVTQDIFNYVTRAECSGEFHTETFCSDLPNSPCHSEAEKTRCFDGNIWNLDSCGNKDKNIRDENAPKEECDYTQGFLCQDEENGKAECRNVNCEKTYTDEKNNHDPEFGGYRDNGESWCIYEGPTGDYLDRPGTIHYRFSCVNGKEAVEPCRNFREEICVQYNENSRTEGEPLGGIPLDFILNQVTNLGQAAQLDQYLTQLSKVNIVNVPLKLESGFNNADCMLNDIYQAEITQAHSTVPLGFAFWEFKGAPSLNAFTTQAGFNTQNQIGMQLSRTLQEQNAQIPRDDLPRTESSRNGAEICAQGNIPPIKVKWETGLPGFCKNECIENCFAEKQDFIDQAAEQCRALGDCGVKLSPEGKLSPGGFLLGDIGSTVINAVGGNLAGAVTGSVIGPLGSLAGGLGGFASGNGYPPSFRVTWKGSAPGEKPTQASQQSILSWSTAKGVFQGMKQLSIFGGDIKKQILTQLGGTGSGGGLSGSEVGAAVWGAGSAAGTLGQAAGILPVVNPIFLVVDIVIVIVLLTVANCDYPTKTVTISCAPWEAPAGGTDCEKCNSFKEKNVKNIDETEANSCTEYKCKALGKACQFIPLGESGVGACVEGSPNDVAAPKISPHKEKLEEQRLTYRETTTGYIINDQVSSFIPLSLAIKTDEYATCFYEDHTTNSIDEMANQFGSTQASQEHILEIIPPSDPDTTKETTYYVRCKDTHDNPSIQYAITFSTEKAVDLQAPIIESIEKENAFLKFGQTEAIITLLVSDSSQVECKYAKEQGKRYDSMNGELFCTETREDQKNYHCSTTLTDLTQEENKFYFKCQDHSKNHFESQEKELILKGSSPFTVLPIYPSPSGTVETSDITLTVITQGGAENGLATCSYGLNRRIIDKMRFTGGVKTHTQPQHLEDGTYTYQISCLDVAGNEAKTTIQFTVDTDDIFSEVKTRLLHIYRENELFIILNKQTTCEYDTTDFKYGEGVLMSETDSTVHSAQLGSSKYIIRCKDNENNELGPIQIIP